MILKKIQQFKINKISILKTNLRINKKSNKIINYKTLDFSLSKPA